MNMIARKLLVAMMALAPAIGAAQWGDDAQAAAPGDGQRTPRFGRFAPPSEQEVEQAIAFMRENAPNRWQAVQALPDDGSALQRNVMGFVVARYRMLQGIKQDDPKLYETKVQQLRVEDMLYGLLSDAPSPPERAARREQLTVAAKRLYELSLDERAHRIDRLKAMVEREEQNLVRDKQQMDGQVAARVDALIVEGQSALRKDFGGGRRDLWRERGSTTQPTDDDADKD